MDFLEELFNRPRERQPWLSEEAYLASAPKTGGMMTEDNRIILNPYSPANKSAIYQNELARLYQKDNPPNFSLTPQQNSYLDTTDYARATPQERMSTIASRLLTNDQSAQKPTFEQDMYVRRLRDILKNYR